MRPLGIIAGSGGLPAQLVRAAEAAGRGVVMAAPEGAVISGPTQPSVRFRMERLGHLFRDLRAGDVEELVFAGAIHRPRLEPRRFDLATLRLLPTLLKALKGGDDAALRSVVRIFEARGFRIRGAHEFLPELLADPGALGALCPAPEQLADAARAAAILAALGPEDVAQACAVARGLCLGIETIYGTDALLGDIARHRPERHPRRGGVLLKLPKPGQDLRMDMPVIGPGTVRAAAAAGLTGICIASGRVMVLEAGETVAAADREGLCLWAT